LIWAGLIAVVLTLLPAPWSTNGGASSLASIYEPLSLVAFVGVAYVYLLRSLRLRRGDKVGDSAVATTQGSRGVVSTLTGRQDLHAAWDSGHRTGVIKWQS
jgi:hypothetical protein